MASEDRRVDEVIPASLLAEKLRKYTTRTPRGEKLEPLLRDLATDLHVPALCDVEVTAVVRQAWRGRLPLAGILCTVVFIEVVVLLVND